MRQECIHTCACTCVHTLTYTHTRVPGHTTQSSPSDRLATPGSPGNRWSIPPATLHIFTVFTLSVHFLPLQAGLPGHGLLMSWQLRTSLGGPEDGGSGRLRCPDHPLPCAAQVLGSAAPLSLISPKVIPRVDA